MSRVKLAVIGLGTIGTLHLGNIETQPKVELTAVCDIVPEKADAAALKYGVKAYYDADALLADRVCDAVIIGTQPFSGAPLVRSSIRVQVPPPSRVTCTRPSSVPAQRVPC